MWQNLLRCAMGAIAISAVSIPSHAQLMSNARPLNIVVPFQGGGPSDAIVRPLAQSLSERLTRPVVVENRPGANGSIGTIYVARQPPNGDTILFHITGFIQTPALSRKSPTYSFDKEFEPVALLGRQAVALAVPGSSPYKTVAELVAAIKAKPVDFAYGSYGVASTSHIYGEVLRTELGVDMPHIAFQGMGPLLQEMLAGRIPIAFVSVVTAVERRKDKSLRILAVTGPTRLASLPDVPTMEELGYEGFNTTGFYALFVSAKTPDAIRTPLIKALQASLSEDAIKTRLNDVGLEQSDETLTEFSQSLKRDFSTWQNLGKSLDISNE
ncbi:Bug family tripartite tricarboxylate transporter substrate binding protein [Achromobacter sp. NPDC058515]|uniref:Bug family tripartite tricarboxylate transporter substrate binding protein n=1 Tax=Achromobacter sp. NPDC058515 TaxID=3346533 RepID=UPI0036687EA4